MHHSRQAIIAWYRCCRYALLYIKIVINVNHKITNNVTKIFIIKILNTLNKGMHIDLYKNSNYFEFPKLTYPSKGHCLEQSSNHSFFYKTKLRKLSRSNNCWRCTNNIYTFKSHNFVLKSPPFILLYIDLICLYYNLTM